MRPFAISCLLSTVLCVGVARAQDCGDYTQHPEIVGQTEILSGTSPASIRALAVGTTHGFAASYGELHVIDISTPNAPSKVTDLALPSPARNLISLQLRGDFLFGTDPNSGSGGFRIVDVSAPAAPLVRGSIGSEGANFGEFALLGSNALVVGGRSSATGAEHFVLVVSLVSTNFPLVLDEVPLPGYGSVLAASGDVMLVGNYAGDVFAFDVTDPLAISPGNSLHLGSRIESISIWSGHAYVNTGDARLVVLDVTDPTSVSAINTVEGLHFRHGQLVAHGDRLYGNGNGLWAVDLTTPAAPSVVGNMSLPTLAYAVSASASADHVFAATNDGEFFVTDWSIPTSVVPTVSALELGAAQDLVVTGQLGFLLAGTSMMALSLADPSVPVELGSVELPEVGLRALVEDGMAYVVTCPDPESFFNPLTLTVCDVSNPLSPSVRGSAAVTALGRVHDLARWGEHLYVTTYETGDGLAYLRIFDVGNPDLPTLESTVYLNFFVGFEGSVWRGPRMDVEKGLLYLSFYNGFDILDLATPTDPTLVHRAQFPWHRSSDLQVVGDRVHVSFHTQDEWYNPPPPPDVERTRGLHVVDVSTPTAPLTLGVYETSASPRDLVVDGSHAYLAVDGKGIEMIDLRNSADPTSDGYLLTFEPGLVRVVRERLYGVFPDAPHLQIAPLPCGAEPSTGIPPGTGPWVVSRLKVQPNPFNPRTEVWCDVGAAGFARVQIFDLRGRLVRTVHEGLLTDGEHRFPWDGTDHRGRSVASGIYRVVLSGEVPSARSGAVLVR